MKTFKDFVSESKVPDLKQFIRDVGAGVISSSRTIPGLNSIKGGDSLIEYFGDEIDYLVRYLKKTGYKVANKARKGTSMHLSYEATGKPNVYIDMDEQNDMATASFSPNVFKL